MIPLRRTVLVLCLGGVGVTGVIAGPSRAVAPATSPQPTAPATSSPVRPNDGVVLRRATLLVHDVDASVAFYRDVLGFTVWLRRDGTSGGDLPTGDPIGTQSRFVIMKGRDPWLGMIGLLQYGAAKKAPKKESIGPGDVVLMIETNEIAKIHERLKTGGHPIVREPRSSDITYGDGSKATATFLFCFDPDGHVLELNERRPK
jgi:catechol 2,3-dioxygenase-like lactoylglutathione lyase family enzyme